MLVEGQRDAWVAVVGLAITKDAFALAMEQSFGHETRHVAARHEGWIQLDHGRGPEPLCVVLAVNMRLDVGTSQSRNGKTSISHPEDRLLLERLLVQRDPEVGALRWAQTMVGTGTAWIGPGPSRIDRGFH